MPHQSAGGGNYPNLGFFQVQRLYFAASIVKTFSNSDVLFSPRLLRGEKEEVSTILKHDSLQTMTFLFFPRLRRGGK
ncbi:MAG: hypothetical protein LBR79_05520 [Oscillospiraceae bacterium]|nr:hypothetical protein [Oscillospiraceae bacterium]